jgi:hypothetical protein
MARTAAAEAGSPVRGRAVVMRRGGEERPPTLLPWRF